MAEADQHYTSPDKSQLLAVLAVFPIGGLLLLLAALSLTATVIGITLVTPLFIIFSPVLIPALLLISLALTGFLTSGAFGITAISSLSWVVNHVRRVTGTWSEQIEQGIPRAQDTAGYLGEKVKETGGIVQSKAREGERS